MESLSPVSRLVEDGESDSVRLSLLTGGDAGVASDCKDVCNLSDDGARDSLVPESGGLSFTSSICGETDLFWDATGCFLGRVASLVGLDVEVPRGRGLDGAVDIGEVTV